MKKKASLLLALACSSCTASLIKTTGDEHTLRFKTGSANFFHDKYDAAFNKKASELCQGSKYEILEQGRIPSTLKECGTLISEDDYFWVVKCKASAAERLSK